MIFLITGSPGAGKTLSTIKFVNEDDQFKGRPIYYFNLNGLELDWNEINEEQLKHWEQLPDNSVIVADEAQRIFPKRGNRDPIPQAVAALDTHRHRGFDFFFITQHPTLIDHDLRKFVGLHKHYERAFGLNSSKCLTWQKAQYGVDDYHIRKEAEVSRFNFDKKYFKTYTSASVHNVKKRMPLKFYGVIAALVLVVGGIFHFATTFGDRHQVDNPISTLSDSLTPGFVNKQPLTKDQYLENLQPRVPNVPWTAPIYDKAFKIVSVPKPQCVYKLNKQGTIDSCQCYSQQATKMNISFDACVSYVDQRYFDPTIPDHDPKANKAQKPFKRASINQQRSRPRSILIPHTTDS